MAATLKLGSACCSDEETTRQAVAPSSRPSCATGARSCSPPSPRRSSRGGECGGCAARAGCIFSRTDLRNGQRKSEANPERPKIWTCGRSRAILSQLLQPACRCNGATAGSEGRPTCSTATDSALRCRRLLIGGTCMRRIGKLPPNACDPAAPSGRPLPLMPLHTTAVASHAHPLAESARSATSSGHLARAAALYTPAATAPMWFQMYAWGQVGWNLGLWLWDRSRHERRWH